MALSIHHLTLTVSNRTETANWLEQLLGDAERIERVGPGFTRTVMKWPDGIWIGVTEHEGQHPDPFSHLNIGVDHFGLKCGSKEEIDGWVIKLDELDFVHGPLEEMPGYWAVTARTPDNIPIEFYCFK
jgi:catechol 2,3-dioxygenase-like lactoylglutathione lyase family enzyme